MSAGKRHGKSTIVLKGYGNMKVYVVTEYGGSYDDAWSKIIGIYTDAVEAEEVKSTYWGKIQNRLKEVNSLLEVYKEVEEISDESPYWNLLNEQYNLTDMYLVDVKEYPVNEFMGCPL